jgi:hypothetical protein
MTVQIPSTNNFALNQPGLLVGGQVIPIKYIDTNGATNGQVPAFNASSGELEYATVSGSGINQLTGDVTAGPGTGSVAATIANNAVTTAKIADNAVTGAKIALTSQVAGDIMYYDGTDWVRLAKGTAGQVLTMNAGATAPEWQTP